MRLARRGRLLVALGATTVACLAVVATVAGSSGTFPGRNGRIVVTDGDRFYLVSAAGTALVNLQTPFAFQGDPAWSPGGKRIAFTATRECCVDYTGLAVTNADGTGVRELIRGSRPGGYATCCPSWSPDGKLLAYSKDEGGDGTDVYVVDPARAGIDKHNRYLPVGRRVFHASSEVAPAVPVVWLSATELVVRVLHSKGTADYAVQADGSGTRPIKLAWREGEPSPDRTMIAYVRWTKDGIKTDHWTKGVQSDLVIANSDGSHAKRVVGPVDDSSPVVWSPDGKGILYLQRHCEPGAERCERQLWVIGVDRRGKRRVSPLPLESDFAAFDWQPLP